MLLKITIRCVLGFFLLLNLFSCKGKDTESTVEDIQETAQQVGDIMASVDEIGGSNGGFALLKSEKKVYARYFPFERNAIGFDRLVLPHAAAELCSVASTFGSCTSSQIIRNFANCSIGSFLTLAGTVTLSFSRSTCALTADADTVTRDPDFTITGRRGGSLAVSKTGFDGQKITRNSATSYSFTNDGIRRVISVGGTTLFDFTTSTTGLGLQITGSARDGRTIDSGSLRVLNNSTEIFCDYAPTAVTYGAGCNCATSGSWTGTCSNGITSSISLTGCGTANFILGTQSEAVTFDRCYTLN